jgi:hypothetical protein
MPKGFAGLSSWVSQVDLAQLQRQSERSAKDPDPGSEVKTIRDREMEQWTMYVLLVLFACWMALRPHA